jgi:predicted nuclease of predicted toxin-antitoxin system
LKLLLDEMFSPAIAQALRARGHDVEAIKEHRDWAGLTDPEVIALARREQRAVVTVNLQDDRRLHAELIAPGSAGHAGLILVPTSQRHTRSAVGRLVAALEAKLVEYPGDQELANAETWL